MVTMEDGGNGFMSMLHSMLSDLLDIVTCNCKLIIFFDMAKILSFAAISIVHVVYALALNCSSWSDCFATEC